MIDKIVTGILILMVALILALVGATGIKIYKVHNPKEEPKIFDTYQKSFYIESFSPPKHVYINVRYQNGKTEKLYVSKHCNKKDKLKSIIADKKLITITFDTYRYVDYDGVLSFYDKQRGRLYDILCT